MIKRPDILSMSALNSNDEVALSEAKRWKWVRGLYELHSERVTRFLERLTDDPTSAEDLVSETFIRAFEVADQYEGRANETTWLFGIALNVARNHRAKERRQRFLRRLFFQPEPQSVSVVGSIEARQQLGILERAVATLPGSLRETYVLRTLEERPLKEVAELLGLPISTVSERAGRADTLVRAKLGTEDV